MTQHLNLTGIQKIFDGTHVLKGVDLNVKSGEFLTLVGPSGCGKSTLLRIIAGLEAADQGRIAIGERDVTHIRASERDLAMVFQSYALYPHLSVAENMMVPLVQREVSWVGRLPLVGPLLSRPERLAAAERVMDAAKTLKIDNLMARKPGQLSGGQRQRVALGRAMVRKPVAFLMDEPLSNLDAALRVHMRAELTALHRALQRTFIYVTHDQAEALTMSDRMAVMWEGRLLQLDTPAEIYARPVDLTVARFIGSPQINTLPAEIHGDGRVTSLGGPLKRSVMAPQGPAMLGLRPEHLAICQPGDEGAIQGALTYSENLGSDVFLHLAVADGSHQIIARCDPALALSLSTGDDVHVRPVRGEALVFDASGVRCDFAARAAEVA